jgi:hypothetical protein
MWDATFCDGTSLGAPSQTIYPRWRLDSRKVLIRNGGNSRPTELCRLFFHLTFVTAQKARDLDRGHSASKRGHQEDEVSPLGLPAFVPLLMTRVLRPATLSRRHAVPHCGPPRGRAGYSSPCSIGYQLDRALRTPVGIVPQAYNELQSPGPFPSQK